MKTVNSISFLVLVALSLSSTSAFAAPKGRVLVVVSAQDKIPMREGGTHVAGVFLGELVEPAEAMLDAGYELVFASPGGKAPVMDPESYKVEYYQYSKAKLEHVKQQLERLKKLGLERPLEMERVAQDDAQLAKFDALFVPGGHAPMVDILHVNAFKSLSFNRDTSRILEFFHRSKRPTDLICHAPAALAAAPRPNGRWIYAGYKMTVIPKDQDWLNEDFFLTKTFPGHSLESPTDVLREAGADLRQGLVPMIPKVVEDRELITGQDPFSASLFGKRLVEKLDHEVR